jgi:chromosome segregation ATPase
MKKQKTARSKTKIQELTHDTVPATVGLVKAVRDELRADIRGVEKSLEAKISSVDNKVDSLGRKVELLDHKVESLDQKVGLLDQKVGSLDHKVGLLDNKVELLDRKVGSIDQKVESLRSEMHAVEYRLDSKIEKVIVAVHQTQILMEEQRGENRIVLDGIKTLNERQDRVERDVDELRGTVRLLKSSV